MAGPVTLVDNITSIRIPLAASGTAGASAPAVSDVGPPSVKALAIATPSAWSNPFGTTVTEVDATGDGLFDRKLVGAIVIGRWFP
jgi:hypothetical protein